MPRVNFADVEEAEDFSLLPDGVYLCAVQAIDDTVKTQAGDEMWDIRFRVEEGDYKGRAIFDRISFGKKALPRVKLLCSRLGMDVEGEVNVQAGHLLGRKVFVNVETEEYVDRGGNEKTRNTVPFAGFMAVSEAEPERASGGPPISAPDDDLPFLRMPDF